jgi:hypothetical protein
MPTISRFYGIAIYMYAGDHLPPHFHAIYSGEEAVVEIGSGSVIKGGLPSRAQKLIREWTKQHKEELLKNFKESQKDVPVFEKIAPLK